MKVLGTPEERFARLPFLPWEVPEAGHFVQEWGEPIARRALAAFGLAGGKPA